MVKKKKEFFQKINKFENLSDLDSFIIYLISPVITGIKPSSTITLNKDQSRRLEYIYDKKLSSIDFEYTKIRSCEKKDLILIYNLNSLSKYLEIESNKKILKDSGYSNMNIKDMIQKLKFKILDGEFPHEIGLFLGIPACDVEGFLNCKKCIHSGYWKVYDNLDIANKLFNLYDLSRNIVIDNTLSGIPLEKTIYFMKNKYLENVDMLQ